MSVIHAMKIASCTLLKYGIAENIVLIKVKSQLVFTLRRSLSQCVCVCVLVKLVDYNNIVESKI